MGGGHHLAASRPLRIRNRSTENPRRPARPRNIPTRPRHLRETTNIPMPRYRGLEQRASAAGK